MKNYKRLLFGLLVLISFPDVIFGQDVYSEFWEGPHPIDPNRKFYIEINRKSGEIGASGYWTENNFYRSKFEVDSIAYDKHNIYFRIPGWGCVYKGTLYENNLIKGGFDCTNEPFDSVQLIKNNVIANYLTLPKENYDSDFKYAYHVPELLPDKINVVKYKTKGDSAFIYSLLQDILDGKYGRINSFLIFKDDKLICEEYFYGFSANDLQHIESSNKSLTSLLIGIAKDKGFIKDLYEPIYKIFPEYLHLKDNNYNRITIYNLLTMTSGFGPEDKNLYKSDNFVDYMLRSQLKDTVGKTFAYNGGNTEILGAIIKRKTGLYADEFASKYLFEPLMIQNYNWEINKKNGFPCMGGSLQLKPRDFAKIGMLVLNDGVFDNEQILSEDWIKESTSDKLKTHMKGDNYSYQWWNITLGSNKKDYHTIWANGWGGQFLYIIPELRLVIATTGYNYENDSWAITKGIGNYIHLLDY